MRRNVTPLLWEGEGGEGRGGGERKGGQGEGGRERERGTELGAHFSRLFDRLNNVITNKFKVELGCLIFTVNSISISGVLTPSQLAGEKVKPRWPPMEVDFVRQFQSSSRSRMSIPVLYTTLITVFLLKATFDPEYVICS